MQTVRDLMLRNPFMTGDIPVHLWAEPVIGELRSYLPPEARVTTLAICLYSAGLPPTSWRCREPEWPEMHENDFVQRAAEDLRRRALFGIGLIEALDEARDMAAEQGRTLVVDRQEDFVAVLPREAAPYLDANGQLDGISVVLSDGPEGVH